jgi:hypothetical protein
MARVFLPGDRKSRQATSGSAPQGIACLSCFIFVNIRLRLDKIRTEWCKVYLFYTTPED